MKLNKHLQNVILNLYGYWIFKKRYNSYFKKFLSLYENNNPNTLDTKQLRDFLKSAKKTKYWGDQFKKYNFNIDSKNLKFEIRKLPILSKEEIKKNYNNILNKFEKNKSVLVSTSGTTGSGLTFPQTYDMERKQWAIWWRYRRWHGINFGEWCGWFGGRRILSYEIKKPPYWKINYPLKQIMFSSHHLNIDTVNYYLDKIINDQITWLHGYPSQLYDFAVLCKKKKISNKKTSIKIISVGAENLLVYQKEIISKVFNANVIQHYGLAEGVSNISENENGDLICDLDFAYTEFIPVNVDKPNICKIIGTNYNNKSFPMIRYDTGDVATIKRLENEKIQIVSIDGRLEDYITLKNGTRLGRLDHLFKNLIHIEKAQIRQYKDRSIEFIIVKGDKYDLKNEEKKLKYEIENYLGQNENISIVYSKNIKTTNAGKHRLVISEIL